MKRSPALLSLPAWWPEVLQRIIGIRDFEAPSLQLFTSAIARLSGHLNDLEERHGTSSVYMRDRRLRHAYLLYYVTANLLKPVWALTQLWPEGPPRSAVPLRVLDIGCGPGTGVAAMHAWYGQTPRDRAIHIEGVDAVEANAALYREAGALLNGATGYGIGCEARAGDALRFRGEEVSYDLVLAMNLLNEMPDAAHPKFLSRCADLLLPGGVLLLIEPALRTTSRALLRLRDQAVSEGWRVRVPCFRQEDCPALANEKDWCHHDLPWERPAFMAWLDESIGNIKKSLKFSCIVLAREDGEARVATDASDRLRVVSELFVEKGRSWCFCCGAAGRLVYQRNTRDRSESNAAFDALQRYDTLLVTGAEQRGHDVRISPSTVVVKS
jgi:SAM-dependent methyltransferase